MILNYNLKVLLFKRLQNIFEMSKNFDKFITNIYANFKTSLYYRYTCLYVCLIELNLNFKHMKNYFESMKSQSFTMCIIKLLVTCIHTHNNSKGGNLLILVYCFKFS